MQSVQQAKEDAEKRARDSQGLLDSANRAITELQAANVCAVYGAIVCLYGFTVAVLNCDEWCARVNVCVKLITVVDVRCIQHLFYPCIGVVAAQAKLQAELAAVSTHAAVVCACVVLYS